MEHQEALEKAMALVRQQKPNASAQKTAAFANSVAYLVTGFSGGYGGPSVREHAVSHMYLGGEYSFDEAIRMLLDDNGPVFGPLVDVHRHCWLEEDCFDDDPEDVVQLSG
jgi:hypothetical protein